MYAQGDLTGNGLTDVVDVQSVAVHWGETVAQPVFDPLVRPGWRRHRDAG